MTYGERIVMGLFGLVIGSAGGITCFLIVAIEFLGWPASEAFAALAFLSFLIPVLKGAFVLLIGGLALVGAGLLVGAVLDL